MVRQCEIVVVCVAEAGGMEERIVVQCRRKEGRKERELEKGFYTHKKDTKKKKEPNNIHVVLSCVYSFQYSSAMLSARKNESMGRLGAF